MGRFLLGVDLGTSNVKAVLLILKVECLFSNPELTIISNSPSEAEQDMEEIWREQHGLFPSVFLPRKIRQILPP